MKYEFTDVGGDRVRIYPNDQSGDPRAIVGAVLDVDSEEGIVVVPPHEVPQAARALYAAAGLPVPDLPDIPDPAEVQELADRLHEFSCGCMPVCQHGQDPDRELARFLMTDGWGRTA